MPTDDAKKAEHLGWRLNANGDIAFIPAREYAAVPLAGNLVVVAIRVETEKNGQTQTQQLQLGFSLQQGKELAEKLLAAVAHAERDAAMMGGKAN